jgi:folate-dependent phosphoribosylglycinamide formyltransferase PurN
LAGPGEATDIVFNYLKRCFDDLVVVQEQAPSRLVLARRRARRLGWPEVAGQVAFVTLAMPILRRRARGRIGEILNTTGLDASAIPEVLSVDSVNDPEVVSLLVDLDPALVVVHGTRVISRVTLESVRCPIVNLHAGITPQYRGVHGGYWALAEGRPDLAGATVHVVDAGIDTGRVLAQATFSPTSADSVVTYPYLQLARGLPLLVQQARLILAEGLVATEGTGPGSSQPQFPLRWHPTLWGYLWRRIRRKAR